MTKKDWMKAFEESDAENTELRHKLFILRMKCLICEMVFTCQDRDILRNIAGFCAGMNNMHFIDDGLDEMRFEPRRKDGAA